MADIIQRFLTNNDCYKAGRKITPKGIMVHSTGANNPKLSRYIQPDDGILGVNPNNNDWNRSGISKCTQGFIGQDKNGKVRIYQTLPWNHRGWHGGGSSNDTHIGFEICEDGLTDPLYFNAIYNETVELCAFLCKLYNLDVNTIICHSEGYKKGIASNHGDVMHWFPKHGKSMDTLRADVKARMNPSIVYAAHCESYGWMAEKRDGVTAGTVGQAKRLEGLAIYLEGSNAKLSIDAHVQNKGWLPTKTNRELVGTLGEGLRLEAIKINCDQHNIAYRVHCENYGWMDWKKNGEVAGTVGESKRIEAIEIKLV